MFVRKRNECLFRERKFENNLAELLTMNPRFMTTKILAIESSCDETSAAVIEDGKVISNLIANQEVHSQYGGVVPEVASRAHQANIVPVVARALEEAQTSIDEIAAIGFTKGPGLLGSLIIGVSFAKALALGKNIPLIEVNHMQAHVLAHFADEPKPEFPFLCLTVSGGHTQIVLVRDYLDMEVIGTTIDDAAGEAFDKTGKMLGLEYPAGPVIEKLAASGTPKFTFPEPDIKGFDFSFSGLKTSILYFLKKEIKSNPDFIRENLADICASVQERIVTILLKKLKRAATELGISELAIAGGVSANAALRKGLEEMGKENGWKTYIPAFELCTDNAAMIGVTAYYKYLEKEFTGQDTAPMAKYTL